MAFLLLASVDQVTECDKPNIEIDSTGQRTTSIYKAAFIKLVFPPLPSIKEMPAPNTHFFRREEI